MKVKYFKEGTLRGEGGPPVHGGWAPVFGSLSRHDTGLCMDANRRQWCRIRRWTAVDQARPLQGTSRKGSPAQRPALKPFHLGDLGLNFLIFVQVPWWIWKSRPLFRVSPLLPHSKMEKTREWNLGACYTCPKNIISSLEGLWKPKVEIWDLWIIRKQPRAILHQATVFTPWKICFSSVSC